MRFYRVGLQATYDIGEHLGYQWFTSRRAADKFANEHRDDCDSGPLEIHFLHGQDFKSVTPLRSEVAKVKAFDITPTKKGILKALNDLAGHADNG